MKAKKDESSEDAGNEAPSRRAPRKQLAAKPEPKAKKEESEESAASEEQILSEDDEQLEEGETKESEAEAEIVQQPKARAHGQPLP